jgi:hypothetical protein
MDPSLALPLIVALAVFVGVTLAIVVFVVVDAYAQKVRRSPDPVEHFERPVP